jgi:stage II sporulation protein AA (anti-sigma F factor antagonist)
LNPFEAVVCVDGEEARVVCSGELDMATAPLFDEAIMRAHQLHPGDITADLAGVTFMDSSGITALVMAHRRIASTRSHLRIENVQPRVARVLELTGVAKHLDRHDTS